MSGMPLRRWAFLAVVAALGIAAVALTLSGPPGASVPVAAGASDGPAHVGAPAVGAAGGHPAFHRSLGSGAAAL